MVKLRFSALVACLALGVAACTPLTPGASTSTPVAPTISASMTVGEFNAVIANGERSILLAQSASTTLLRAGRINIAKDQLVQKQLTLLHDSLMMAKALQVSDPTQASADLNSAMTQIAALKTQTGVTTP